MTIAPASDFIDSVGVNIHLTAHPGPYYDSFTQILPILQDLGIKHVRDNPIFHAGIDQNYYLYQHLLVLAAGGIKVCAVCNDPLNGFSYVPPGELQNIVKWSGGLTLIEGSNEPNIARSNFAPLISRDYQAAINSAAKALAIPLPVSSPSYIQGAVPVIADGSIGLQDFVSIHPYPGMEHPEAAGAASLAGFIAASQAKLGVMPAMATENGYHTALQTTSSFLPVSEEIKARYLPRMLLFGFISGVKRTYLYQLVDHINNGQADAESNFGLLDYRLNQKLSYVAVKNLLSLFKSTGNAPLVDLPYSISCAVPVQSVMFQRANGTHILFVWQGVSGWDPVKRLALAPVFAPASLTVSASTRVLARHFVDTGAMSATVLNGVKGFYNISVSDQLTAYDIS